MLFHHNAVKSFRRLILVSLYCMIVICGVQRESQGQTTFAQTSAETLDPNLSFHPGLIRVDFSITSSRPTRWVGEIRLSRGSFADLVPLGISASSGSDFYFSDASRNCLLLRTNSPATFCGVETTIIAPRDSRLEVRLLNVDSNRQIYKTIFVERLIDSSTSISLDDQNNSVIEITRAPADELPVFIRKFDANAQFDSPALFKPNETFTLTVVPRSSSTKLSNDLTLVATAKYSDSGAVFWNDSREVPLSLIQQNDVAVSSPSGRLSSCNFNITTPGQSGVFDVTLELFSKTSGSHGRLSLPLPSSRKSRPEGTLIARRVVEGVVLSDASNETETKDALEEVDGNLRGELLSIIDPTNPTWYKTFSKRYSLPFIRSSSNGASNNEKTGKLLRSTFAVNENESQDHDDRRQTFAESNSVPEYRQIEPLSDSMASNISSPSRGYVLGQSPGSNSGSVPFNVNIFGIGKTDSSKDSAELTEAQRRLNLVRRWEGDGFNSFLRSLDRSSWNMTGDLWDKQLSSGSSRLFNTEELRQFAPPQRNFVRLAPNNENQDTHNANNKALEALASFGIRYDSVSWEAYPIPIQEPGKPHLLEIEYPTNFPQKLGVSILEQSFSGALLPSGNDSGIVVDDNPFSDRASRDVSRFTMVFWPRTKTPVILVSNCSVATPAAYGQIRIYRASDEETKTSTPNRGRIFGLTITKPNLCEQFSTVLQPSFFGIEGAENWKSFDDAISRALYYLSAYNYDVMALSVVADGSSLYPSALINPTPKFDGGVFLATGGDQERKDVLSLAASKFESQGKSLIPIIKLNSTTPGLEARLNMLRSNAVSERDRATLEGIEWIGIDARRLIDSRRDSEGGGPYYNVLHPEVEKEVLAIVRELVSRCAPYNSFGGLALDVGSDGWLALPDDVYFGLDDETIARFIRESNLQNMLLDKTGGHAQELLQFKGPERYRRRAKFIRDFCLNEWLNWRADALCGFYRKVRETVAAIRPDARLYLIATNALDGPFCQATLYPTLNGSSRLREALRLIGLDPVRFATLSERKPAFGGVSQVGFVSGVAAGETYDSSIALLRPETVALTSPFSKTAIVDELATPDAISLFSAGQAFPGAVFLHESEKKGLYDFDLLSPFHASFAELNTVALPADYDNRRRFARTLAVSDCLCFFDGGDLLPLAQEESLRDWIYAFKSLPAVPFRTWNPKQETVGSSSRGVEDSSLAEANAEPNEKSIQPLVVRYYRNSRETWIYVLNAAPFHTNVKMTISRKSKVPFKTYMGLRHEEPISVSDSLVWNFTATPYDLVALRVADPKARIDSVNVTCPEEICGPNGRMHQTVQDFVDRVVAAQKGLEIPLKNGDFEEIAATEVTNVSDAENSSDRTNLFKLEIPQSSLFKKSHKNEDNTVQTPEQGIGQSKNDLFDPTHIPGWRAFGPNDVDVRLDREIVRNGSASLKISSKQSSGGVISQPFPSPATGRLCAQINLGVPQDTRDAQINVYLSGRKNGAPFNRRIEMGPTIMKKLRDPNLVRDDSSVVWFSEVLLFDRLPLDGLEDLALRFELAGNGVVWLDHIRLYRLAFASSEQSELMKLINTADYRAYKGRVLDVMFMLDSYWARLLKDQIPDDSPIMTARTPRTAIVAEKEQENISKDESKSDNDKSNKSGWSRFKIW
jgi:hypothetical protein